MQRVINILSLTRKFLWAGYERMRGKIKKKESKQEIDDDSLNIPTGMSDVGLRDLTPRQLLPMYQRAIVHLLALYSFGPEGAHANIYAYAKHLNISESGEHLQMLHPHWNMTIGMGSKEMAIYPQSKLPQVHRAEHHTITQGDRTIQVAVGHGLRKYNIPHDNIGNVLSATNTLSIYNVFFADNGWLALQNLTYNVCQFNITHRICFFLYLHRVFGVV